MKYDKKKVGAILKKTDTTKFDFHPMFWEREDYLEKFMEYLEDNQKREEELKNHIKFLKEKGATNPHLYDWVAQKEEIARIFKTALIEED